MAIYYKFKSAKAFDSIPIEGQFISVANLKERIFESKHLGRGTDFDLMVSNAQSNEEYVDEAAMIPKNTSVLIRRVPGRPRMPIVTEPDMPKTFEDKAEEVPPQSNMLVGDSSTTTKYLEESEWDEFGNDLYAIPDVSPSQLANSVIDVSTASKLDEENKIKALIETPALDWSRQGQDGYGGGRGFGRGMGGRMSGRGFGRGGGFESKTPPAGYICHRCKIPGHFIQHCPTNGDPNYDISKVKPPTGIPKSMLMATPGGSYALPSGAVAVLKPNEAAFEKEIEGMPSTRPANDIPPELRCPLCKEVMKDAVLTSKCCFRSFCDKCIRDYIIGKSMCVCGATNILADDLLPNKTLRETISRILESTTSSTENVGSMVQVQDMESRVLHQKVRSPTRSVASKDDAKRVAIDHSSHVKVCHANAKEADAASEGKAVNNTAHSLEKKTIKSTDQSDATPESMSAKEPIPEEGQDKLLNGEQGKKKRKKKTRLPGSAADMQWRGYQDFGAEAYGGMPLDPSAAYNPYWGGGMPMGMDGYMAPFGNVMPYMGYVPGPFDVPFGGMLPPIDPFAAQGYMMPPLPPRDLAELGFNSMNMNRGPPMSREVFEHRKAELRRKHEFERGRLNEREHPRDGRFSVKEAGSSAADVSTSKVKPRRLMPQADQVGRTERASYPNGHHHEHSPPPRPPTKRRSSEWEERKEEERAESKADQKQKASVFSRISFPSESEKEKEKEKKRKTSSSDVASGSIKDHNHHHHHHRDEPARHKAGSAASNGYSNRRNGGGYEHDELSEDEDEEEEEYHFKRRPPSSSSSRRERTERDVSKEREHRGHERVESKLR